MLLSEEGTGHLLSLEGWWQAGVSHQTALPPMGGEVTAVAPNPSRVLGNWVLLVETGAPSYRTLTIHG